MARPQALQFLRKGALLVGKVFPRFVETWNWLIGAFDAMVGDEDIDPKNGYIRIDRTNPDRPVIRLNALKLPNGGGGGSSSGGGESWRYGRFSVVRDDESGEMTLKDCYYLSGGYIKYAGPSNLSIGINCFVIPCGKRTYTEPPHYQVFLNETAIIEFSENPDYFVIPLYTVVMGDDGKPVITLDWRLGPCANMWEGV